MAVGRRSVLRALVAVACAMLLGPAAALADSSPSASLTAAFSPSTVALNGSSTLTFTLTSPAGLAISAAGLEAFVPDGIGLTPVTEGECGGTLSVSESAYENPLLVESPTYGVQLSGASLALGTTCQFALPVVGDAAGTAQLELDGAPYVTVGANPTLTVTPSAQPPVVTASFADPRIEVGQTTDLTRVSHFSGWKWRRRPVGAGLWFEALSGR